MNWRLSLLAATAALAAVVPSAARPPAPSAPPQQGATGSVRGVVYDRDFDAPLAGAEVSILELGTRARVTTAERGNYLIQDVPPGTYTVVFRKENYVNQVRGEVVVSAGQLTEIDVYLAVDFY